MTGVAIFLGIIVLVLAYLLATVTWKNDQLEFENKLMYRTLYHISSWEDKKCSRNEQAKIARNICQDTVRDLNIYRDR